MGSKGSSTTSTSQPPKEVMEMYKYLTSQGKELQKKPYEAYTGELVPQMNQYQTAALGQTQKYSDVASPYYQKAAEETAAVTKGYTPEAFQQGVETYMSPYTKNVADATMKNLMETQAQERNFALSKAVGSGAFGGDRGGIVASELARQQGLATAGAMAPIYQQGYTQAADLYNKGLAGRGMAAQQYANLGQGLQSTGLAGAGALGQAGSVPYQIQSALDAANYQQFAQKQAYPFQTLGFLANIASGLGGGMGGTTTQTQPGPSWLSQLAGLGTLWASLPSDERLKEGMEPVGKTFDGQTIYKYRLKGDHKTQIGLSAQEVEKRHPNAVAKDGQGMRHVNYDEATEKAAHRGHFMEGGVSQGGLVPAGMERQAFPSGGLAFGYVPYEEDPLYVMMMDRSKFPSSSYIPKGEIARMNTRFPEAPRLDDTALGFKGLSPLSSQQITDTRKMLSDLLGYNTSLDRTVYPTDTTDYSSSPYYGSGGPRGSYRLAHGGLVPRSHHANGETAQGDVDAAPAYEPSFAEKMFNKGEPFSEQARAGLMAAGLGMLASRSPFPLVGIGEGGIAGLNTYYQGLQNQRELAKQQAELKLNEEQRRTERGRLFIEEFNKNMGLLAEMRTRLGMLQAGGLGDSEQAKRLQGQINALSDQVMATQSSGLSGVGSQVGTGVGLGMRPSMTAPPQGTGVVAPAQGAEPATDETKQPEVSAAVDTAKTTTAEPAPTTAPAQPSAAQPPAAQPAGQPAGQPTTPATNAQPATSDEAASKNFYDSLNPENNPMVLSQRSRAAYAASNMELGKHLADMAIEEANRIRDTGQGIGKNGESIRQPSSQAIKEENAKMADNIKYFNEMADKNLASIPKAMANANMVKKVLAYYQTGNLAGLKRDLGGMIAAIPGLADAIDANDEQSAIAAFDKFQKNAIASVFNEVKDIGGKVLVSEIEGLQKATVNPTLDPKANSDILAQQMAALQIMQDYFDEAVKEKDRVGYSKFDQSSFVRKFKETHNFDDYVAKNRKDIAARGATPPMSQPNQFKVGQLYVLEKPDESGKMRPYTARFMGFNKDDQGKPISGKWQVEEMN